MRILVHLTTGIENPTKAALALLVASTAQAEGHDVDVFIAGDGVGVIRPESAALAQGIGTGAIADHLGALRAGGANLYASGMSAAARGMNAEQLAAEGFTASPPSKLVELVVAADRTITY